LFWLLAVLIEQLPEVGNANKPKLARLGQLAVEQNKQAGFE